ncbi:glycine receptor subunit alpha-3-like [Argonauta hians]
MMGLCLIWCLCCSTLVIRSVAAQMNITRKDNLVTRSLLIQVMLREQAYDKRLPPNFDKDLPTRVNVSLDFNSFDSIDEMNMEFGVNLVVEQEWIDNRLHFYGLIDSEVLELDVKMMDELWVPDIYISNEKVATFHTVTVPNKMMHLYQNGRIIYRNRISLRASCPMQLQKYPMDQQICYLHLQSFAYTEKRLQFHWNDNQDKALQMIKAVHIMPQFEIMKWSICDCNNIVGSQETFSCLRAEFHLKRNMGFYILNIYCPCSLTVLVSWFSFWLNIDAVPARTSLGVVTVLTMTSQTAAAVSALPKVSYIKAIDIWMAICLIFVFLALLEYALVNVLNRREIKRYLRNRPLQMDPEKLSLAVFSNGYSPPDSAIISYQIDPNGKYHARKVDKYSRVIFPLIFLIFSSIYWTYYLGL